MTQSSADDPRRTIAPSTIVTLGRQSKQMTGAPWRYPGQPVASGWPMPGATFNDVFDWLADRKGQRVYIEVGRPDPQNEEPADFAVLGLHTTLGDVRTVEDRTRPRRALRVLIADDDRSGIEIDEARFERAKIHGAGLKVWQYGVYIGVSGGVRAALEAARPNDVQMDGTRGHRRRDPCCGGFGRRRDAV